MSLFVCLFGSWDEGLHSTPSIYVRAWEPVQQKKLRFLWQEELISVNMLLFCQCRATFTKRCRTQVENRRSIKSSSQVLSNVLMELDGNRMKGSEKKNWSERSACASTTKWPLYIFPLLSLQGLFSPRRSCHRVIQFCMVS